MMLSLVSSSTVIVIFIILCLFNDHVVSTLLTPVENDHHRFYINFFLAFPAHLTIALECEKLEVRPGPVSHSGAIYRPRPVTWPFPDPSPGRSGPVIRPGAVCSHGTHCLTVHGPVPRTVSHPAAVCSTETRLLTIHGALPGPHPAQAPLALPDPAHSSSVRMSVASSDLQNPARFTSVRTSVASSGIPNPAHSSSVRTSVASSSLLTPAHSSSV